MDIRFAVRYAAIKTFWFFVRPFQQTYRQVFQPAKKSVKVIIENGGEILLIRPNYSHRLWSLPGGGLKRGESFEEAVCREIQEELGITLLSPLEFLGSYPSMHQNFDVRTFFALIPNRTISVDRVEILDAKWFYPNALPEERAHRMDSVITAYLQKHKIPT